MGTQDDKDTSSLIAQAIRAKRGERQSATVADMEALEASLLADIEAFEMRALSTESSETPKKPSSPLSQGLSFPALGGNEARQPASAKPATPRPVTPAPIAPPAEAPAVGGSLLDQLRQQASARQQATAADANKRANQAQAMDRALRLVFKYLHELVEQLNVLHPPVGRCYTLLGGLEFSNLTWSNGFVDYRTSGDSGGTQYEQVQFSYVLKGATPLTVNREGPAIESFRKTLFDSGLAFTADEKRNARHLVEKVIYAIPQEVKVNLRFQADLDNGRILLDTRHLERFGLLRYLLPLELVNQAMLEEFGRLVLGQPHRFRDYYRHQ